MERNLRRALGAFIALFCILAFYVGYISLRFGPKLASDPGNPRITLKERSVHRGDILARDGEVLATTSYEGSGPRRIYMGPLSLAHIIGYVHPSYGKSGIEREYNAVLISHETGYRGILDAGWASLSATPRGYDLVLTIDLKLQRSIEGLLRGMRGAIVVLRPDTGEVLAMASSPAFDPNSLDRDWDRLLRDPESPLLPRETQGLYTPGSAFKVILAAAALEAGVVSFRKVFRCPGYIEVGGKTVGCISAHGRLNFERAFAVSCNVTFIKVGQSVGPHGFYEMARRFGFNLDLPFDLPLKASSFPEEGRLGPHLLAQVSIGQGPILVTPLHMAMVAATVANRGAMMRPFIVSEVRGDDGIPIKRTRPQELARPITEATAEKLTTLMKDVVAYGTGYRARVGGLSVAGKTGTAENPHGQPHAWFIGFAPADHPKIAFSVVVENGGFGGTVAAPIAQKIILEAAKGWR